MSFKRIPQFTLLVACFCLLGCKDPSAVLEDAAVCTAEPSAAEELVALSSGSVRADVETLSIAAVESDFAALSALTALRSVDFSGSECLDSVLAYREAHPDVAVSYTVPYLSDSVAHDVSALTVPDGAAISAAEAAAAYLPNLSELSVEAPLSVSEAETLLAAFAPMSLHYSVSFAGQTVASDCTEADWSMLSPDLADALAQGLAVLPNLQTIRLGHADGTSDWALEQVGTLQAAREGLCVDFPIHAFGTTFSTADELISLNEIRMRPHLDELRALVPYLTCCKQIDMENCRVSNEQMAALREELAPDIKVVWMIRCDRYEARTDSIMIKFSTGKPMLTDDDVKALKYCNEVRYLDLGHNRLRRMEFLAYMPDLEVCIIAVNSVIDISGVEHCKKLEYCEFLSGIISDISPLAECTELKHLNIAYNHISDISPLYGLTKLERLWISRNPIPEAQIEHIRELLPVCEINTTSHNPTGEGWREHPRYDLLREQFYYDFSGIKYYVTPPVV